MQSKPDETTLIPMGYPLPGQFPLYDKNCGLKKIVKKNKKKAFSQNNLALIAFLRLGIRAVSSGLHKIKINGSMTVEAALVMPVFLFFMMSVLYVFQIINTQTETYTALHQRGNRIAFEGYQNRAELGDGVIDLTESYQIKPYLFWQDFGQLKVVQQYYGYAWVGYDVSRGGNSEVLLNEYVYITETGTVYHVTMECSHLKLSITSINSNEISSKRNESGGKYHQCERCPKEDNGILFITAFGTRYHSNINCSGLKRTVRELEINEAVRQGYRGCSRC
ncbi:MAG: pilus assembly protein [Lachnospiraceae bacterium]|nr:pilus assembly protein [Lachnospiraceae bacterium]